MLITGVMGSKSTLLAAILRHIIEKGGRHVCTYEAPIEFGFGRHSQPWRTGFPKYHLEHLQSFLTATRNSTRTAPDVVLIGKAAIRKHCGA